MRRAAFLDRDGVINRPRIVDGKPYPPVGIQDLELEDGVTHAVSQLKSRGLLVIVVTNQPDVARGTTSRDAVDAIHSVLRRQLEIDDIFVCFHDDNDDCDCRKPRPGLIWQAAERWHIDVGNSFLVGDRWRDIDAGNAAGCTSIFINRGYSERQPTGHHFETKSLAGASDLIIDMLENQGIENWNLRE